MFDMAWSRIVIYVRYFDAFSLQAEGTMTPHSMFLVFLRGDQQTFYYSTGNAAAGKGSPVVLGVTDDVLYAEWSL
jgi:hypothetical protein